MIALAVAALLTTTALTIWGAKVARRPVDWSGPFTQYWLVVRDDRFIYPSEQRELERMMQRAISRIMPLPMDWQRSWLGQAVMSTPLTPPLLTIGGIQAAHDRFVRQRDQERRRLAPNRVPDLALLRALRASERDDQRREGQ